MPDNNQKESEKHNLDLDETAKELIVHEIYRRTSTKIEEHLQYIFKVGTGVLFVSSFFGLISFGFIVNTIKNGAEQKINDMVSEVEKDARKINSHLNTINNVKAEIDKSKEKVDRDKSYIETYKAEVIALEAALKENLVNSGQLQNSLKDSIKENRNDYGNLREANKEAEIQLGLSQKAIETMDNARSNNSKELRENLKEIKNTEDKLLALEKEYQDKIDQEINKISQVIGKINSCHISSGIQNNSVNFPVYKYEFDVGEIQNQSFLKNLKLIDYKTVPEQQEKLGKVELGETIYFTRINSDGKDEEYSLRLLSLVNHDNEKYDMALFELCGKLSYIN